MKAVVAAFNQEKGLLRACEPSDGTFWSTSPYTYNTQEHLMMGLPAIWRPSVYSQCRLWRLHTYVVTKIFTSKNVLLLHRVYSVNHGHNKYGVTQLYICNIVVNNSCTFAVRTGKLLQSPWHLAMVLQHCDGPLRVTQLPTIFQLSIHIRGSLVVYSCSEGAASE